MSNVSIVIAVKHLAKTSRVAINTVVRQAESRRGEVLVVTSLTTAELNLEQSTCLKMVNAPADELVPELWARGIEAAEGEIIAILDPFFAVSSTWFEAVEGLSEMNESIGGIGGPIRPSKDATLKDWAYFFTRYSGFLSSKQSGKDIAGDNACYRSCLLRQYSCAENHGFWETIFHEQLKSQNRVVQLHDNMSVELLAGITPPNFFQERLRHGIHFGSTRTGVGGISKLIRIATAPLLVPYLVARIVERVRRNNLDLLPHVILSLPWLILFICGWSIGETVGYIRQNNDSGLKTIP